MKILSIELSTRQGSLAVLDGTNVLAESEWSAPMWRAQQVFQHLDALQGETDIRWPELDMITVGRGPGNFSGMRVGMTMARMLALPHDIPVMAVSSGRALAWQEGTAADVSSVCVIGDARREMLWRADVAVAAERAESQEDWRLEPADDPAPTRAALIVSSDWTRLQERRVEKQIPGPWIERDVYPTAASLGRLALFMHRRGESSEPLTPLYMHPPVFVPKKNQSSST